MPKRFLERFKKIDNLISIRGTGTPAQFADKLELSESMLYEYLSVLREQGAPIAYDKEKQTYYYEKRGSFKIIFEETP
jgi:predicted DNA-binding transcriptional regulator YafY